jgi:[ribosomal protein S5]-alanine N-acetyltransferase
VVWINGERVTLRELTLSDEAFVHTGASDLRVVEYMTWGPNSVEDTATFLSRAIAAQSQSPRYEFHLAITAVGDGRIVGVCGLERDADPGADRAEMGYWLATAEWGRGFATEAAGLLLVFALADLGIGEVLASCADANTRSANVLRKNGMRRMDACTLMIRGTPVAGSLYAVPTTL